MTPGQRLGYAILLLLIPLALGAVVVGFGKFVLTGDARWLIPAAISALYLWRLIR